MKLLKKQKNYIYNIAELIGLNINYFSFSTGKIIYSNEYEFIYSNNLTLNESLLGDSFVFQFSPGKNKYTERYSSGNFDNFDFYVKEWMINLKSEIDEPDFWNEYKNKFTKLNFIEGNSEENFSEVEIEILTTRIRDIKQQIVKQKFLETEQQKRILEKLEYLIEQSNKQSKFDWKSLFYGTIINLMIQTSFSPESSIKLFGILKQTFSNLILK